MPASDGAAGRPSPDAIYARALEPYYRQSYFATSRAVRRPTTSWLTPYDFPAGLVLVIAWFALRGAVLIGVGLFAAIAGLFLASGVIGAILVILGVMNIATGVGLFRKELWAWWLAMAVLGFNFILAWALEFYAGLPVPAIVMTYLAIVRKFFD